MNDDKKSIADLIRESWANGSPTDWFEEVYKNAANNGGVIPWANMRANPELVEWLDIHNIDGLGKSALVVGCGLGDDADELAKRGFRTTAFDVSATAVQECKRRFPDSDVTYVVMNLLDTPEDWRGAFDLVFESRTIQSLPYDLYSEAMSAIAQLVTPDGTLLVLCLGRDRDEDTKGIPWALSRAELAEFEQHGLAEQSFDDRFADGMRRFRVVYKKT
jgi:SAM-dependent methyltransferase